VRSRSFVSRVGERQPTGFRRPQSDYRFAHTRSGVTHELARQSALHRIAGVSWSAGYLLLGSHGIRVVAIYGFVRCFTRPPDNLGTPRFLLLARSNPFAPKHKQASMAFRLLLHAMLALISIKSSIGPLWTWPSLGLSILQSGVADDCFCAVGRSGKTDSCWAPVYTRHSGGFMIRARRWVSRLVGKFGATTPGAYR